MYNVCTYVVQCAVCMCVYTIEQISTTVFIEPVLYQYTYARCTVNNYIHVRDLRVII